MFNSPQAQDVEKGHFILVRFAPAKQVEEISRWFQGANRHRSNTSVYRAASHHLPVATACIERLEALAW